VTFWLTDPYSKSGSAIMEKVDGSSTNSKDYKSIGLISQMSGLDSAKDILRFV
jgi:hypothetical protein